MITPLKLSFYARTSTEGQRKEKTIKSQKEEFLSLLQKRSIDIAGGRILLVPRYAGDAPEDPESHFLDDGFNLEDIRRLESGSALADLISSIKARLTNAIYVYDIDRIFRSQSEEINGRIKDLIRRYRVTLLSESGDFQAGMALNVLAMMGPENKRVTCSRLHDAKFDRARSEGRPPNGKSPFGYEWDRNEKNWSIVEPEAQLIRWAGALTQGLTMNDMPAPCDLLVRENPEGASDRQIAEVFNTLGYTIHNYLKRNRLKIFMQKNPLGRFKESFIASWFRDDRYCGSITYRFKETELLMHPDSTDLNRDDKRPATAMVPQILSESEWASIRTSRSKRQFTHKRKRNQAHEYLLKDLLVCGLCGRRMDARPKYGSSNQEAPPILYYQCSRRRIVNGPSCPQSNYHNASALEPIVWAAVKRLILEENVIGALEQASHAPAQRDHSHLQKSLKDFEAKSAELHAERERVATLLVKGTLPEDLARSQLQRIETDQGQLKKAQNRIQAELDFLLKRQEEVRTVDLRLLQARYRSRLQELSFKEKRALVLALLKSATVSPRPKGTTKEKPKVHLQFWRIT